jgi:hypothetical protein
MGSFFKNLGLEIIKQGKLLTGYVLEQAVSDYPGIGSAVKEVINDPSPANFANLAIQSILVVGASHRVVKIISSTIRS